MSSAEGIASFQPELIEGATEVVAKPRKPRASKSIGSEHLPPNLSEPIPVKVPDFSDPKRPKTCLEVDFPIVPINALSALEGNAGKPIYQMSKWWARRRSCVFRAMLIAAAMEAPVRKGPDGKALFDENGQPIPDETEAHKAVWDVYYANHQKAGNFKHLKVLDCFMGGGTTLVEGSRLGFQVTGVDLNPVAWFIVKNELACTDPVEVKTLFDRIEAEVKPQVQPFFVTDCPRGHKGKWYDTETGKLVDFEPTTLPPDERKKCRYEGPEIIYTFWAKHGPCIRPECGHRTPIFRSPVIAEKELGVKFLELTCKKCKSAFHAELGSARIAPAAEHVVLDNEFPYTELSQGFAKRLLDYGKGDKAEKVNRIHELCDMVDVESGLACPSCGEFAGQWLRDVLRMHRSATRVSDIDKKHLKIQPSRNGTKSVFCYLLVHTDWLKGAPGQISSEELGGHADSSPDANARWYHERLENLRLIEVRGRIKIAADTSTLSGSEANKDEKATGDQEAAAEDSGDNERADRKTYGLPRFIRLGDGSRLDTRFSTVPKQSHFTCGGCGQMQDFRYSVQATKRLAPVAPYAVQGFSGECETGAHAYGGRFFKAPTNEDIDCLVAAEREWAERRNVDLVGCWPQEKMSFSYMTHQANFALPEQGYTHWWKMFNPRQLLVHSALLRAASRLLDHANTYSGGLQVLGACQQYLRNQNMFSIWNVARDHFAAFLGNSNFAPKYNTIESGAFVRIGYGSWPSTISSVVEGAEWAANPWEAYLPPGQQTGSIKALIDDPVIQTDSIECCSSTELSFAESRSYDLVITDPPFGDNIFYSDLSNFFHVWIRLPLKAKVPALFEQTTTPQAQEALAPRGMPEEEANARYQALLTGCWTEAHRVMKDGGLLAFTFHHSEDAQWAIVLQSLFDSGFILEQVFPIASDETKGEDASFGAKGTEYDMIHVCRKRLEDPTPVSWPKMRQWVKAELRRLRGLLEAYKANELSDADIRVILRGKALEFYSRHYGKVFTGAEDAPMSIRDALLGINQLLDEDTGQPGERPPSILQPVAYQFLRLFGTKTALSRDDVGKNLRGTGLVQRELEDRGWVAERNKVVSRVPIKDRFEIARGRPRREMKTEIDQAHFLIGAALPESGLNIQDELGRNTWAVRRSVEAVLQWYAKTAVEPEIRTAAELAAKLLRDSLEKRRAQLVQEQGFLFDDLDEVA